MRSALTWQANTSEGQAPPAVVYDLCFNPLGSQLVVASGQLVLVYDASDGSLLHKLKGHKDTVYCVTYSKDGKRFASGGADKNVIIWKNTAEGILKFAHNDTIQALSYNPVSLQLASVTATDFGIWSPDQKSVSKHKIQARGLCCSWSNDGTLLAIGQYDGNVTVRTRDGKEKLKITRNAPVWSVNFRPNTQDGVNILAVGTWDQMLTLHDCDCEPTLIGKKELNMDPCSVRYFSNGEYMVVGGSDCKTHLCNHDGVQLQMICERDDWIWSIAPRPKQNYIAVACNDGTISMYQLIFSTVHGLYQDRYAYRDFMTNVIVQNLVTEQKAKIQCQAHVKKIAIYKDRLAIQLPDKIQVYERKGDDDHGLQYVKRSTINKSLDCNLLVVTSNHLILCLEKKLQLLNFEGVKEREWVLDAIIRYIKIAGGPPRREGLLVGLKNGQVLQIFIDNPFPISIVNHDKSIRCLDISCSRRKLALVDELANVVVYDVQTQEELYRDVNANSVAWNSVLESQLCYSGKDQLSIKTGDFPPHREKMRGFVVGVRGSKVFCLHYLAMNTVNVPQSAAMYRYLEKKMMSEAYKVATMGVTESDWQALAMEALMVMDLEVAQKAFIRNRDMRYIDLINRIKASRKLPGHDDNVFLAEALALRGQYQEAGKVYAKSGRVDLAIKMFSDLKLWEDARNIANHAQGVDIKDLTREQALWAVENNDWKTAAAIFVTSEEYGRAINIMSQHNMVDELIDVVRRLDKNDVNNLAKCADAFRTSGHTLYAKETYIKMSDTKSLMELYVESEKWDEAFLLLKQYPYMKEVVYLPYATWLSANDRFEEAQEAFRMAGSPQKAIEMLETLSAAAVSTHSYKNAGYYYWMRAIETNQLYPPGSGHALEEQGLQQFLEFSETADIFYAYQIISDYITEPFFSGNFETVFHTARFLLSLLQNRLNPPGVSKVYILWALAETALKFECFKVARRALDQLSNLHLPDGWGGKVDLASLKVRSKPVSDKDGFVSQESVFSGVRSFANFDVLPLVEFRLDKGISDEEAERLLSNQGGIRLNSKSRSGGRERQTGSGNMLTFDDDDVDMNFGNDSLAEFQQQLLSAPSGSLPSCSREILAQLNYQDVIILKSQYHLIPTRYFRVMVPDTPVYVCQSCSRMFIEEDFEILYLKDGCCPFCRSQNTEEATN
mmetsp:Transcript_33085/g.104621  ORF Transcript_33085/g.104621 Transcript_33085/m.104621 type:complete len:1177 (+) Transcript_33085:130-3660(+)